MSTETESAGETSWYGFGCEKTEEDLQESFASIELTSGAAVYPESIDLQWKMTSVANQGKYGSCVGFATCAMLEIVPNVIGIDQDESERFMWYNAKNADGGGNPTQDRGTFLWAAVSQAQALGSCWEHTCPYGAPLSPPSARAYDAAKNMRVLKAYRLPGTSINDYKNMLSIGWPVMFGFHIFGDGKYLTGDYTRQTGIMLMPPTPTPKRTNGHAVVMVGYDDNTRLFKFKNSWGTGFGRSGYVYMPYDYIRWTYDAWVLWDQSYTTSTLAEGSDATIRVHIGEVEGHDFKVSDGKQPCDYHYSVMAEGKDDV